MKNNSKSILMMKQTYIKPETELMESHIEHSLLAASPNTGTTGTPGTGTEPSGGTGVSGGDGEGGEEGAKKFVGWELWESEDFK